MAFIRVQNAKKDDRGNIIGGSASIVESVYQSTGSSKCKQVLRESLGTIIFMENRHSGVFMSKTRGLIAYDSKTDEFLNVEEGDIRIENMEIIEPRIHTLFGDTFAMMEFLKTHRILNIFRNLALDNDILYEKMVCHTLHGLLRDGSRIGCDRFVERSFISNVISGKPSTMRTDSRYYSTMGSYEMKVEFFREFIKNMKLQVPGFGVGCYVDSTPLPNSITNLPMSRLCSHGLASTSTQMRLVFVLDIRTGLPVWFEIIPGNVLDLSTIMDVTERVSKLFGVTISDMVLDAGYVCKNVIKAYNRDNNADKTLIARMPAKKGYGVDDLFNETRRLFSNAKYGFVRQNHTYFGIRKEKELFGCREFVYVYLDDENASSHYKSYLQNHAEEYENMSMVDKNRIRYKGGFFTIVSNIETTPERLLDLYFGRTEIETAINTGKEYLELLPLNKHNEETIRGKLFQDIITLISYMMVRKVVSPTGRSVSDTIYDLQSVMCFRQGDDITVEYINKQAKETFDTFGISPPGHINIGKYKNSMYFSS